MTTMGEVFLFLMLCGLVTVFVLVVVASMQRGQQLGRIIDAADARARDEPAAKRGQHPPTPD